MITSFPVPTKLNNTGGQIKFLFVPCEDLESSPNIFNNAAVDAHVFKEGKDWLTGFFDTQTAKLVVNDASDSKGTLTKSTFTATITDDSATLDQLFCDLRCKRTVLLVVDRNKVVRILGTKSCGCTFNFTFNSQAKFSDQPVYDFSFYWESNCIPPATGEITDIC